MVDVTDTLTIVLRRDMPTEQKADWCATALTWAGLLVSPLCGVLSSRLSVHAL